MSRRNRQKRAAKHKDRRRASSQRERWSTDPGYDRVAILDRLTAALYNSALCPDHDAEFHAAELLDEWPCGAYDLDLAAEGTLAGAISGAWQVGWSPNDLHEFARAVSTQRQPVTWPRPSSANPGTIPSPHCTRGGAPSSPRCPWTSITALRRCGTGRTGTPSTITQR
ncbi:MULTISPECIES: hypothetical protein [Mycolicibacterium]|jgi:hypothetical protein|uniref:hypothetical protein n=1 Tax=Mycolicibacterium TaxID=1866885 RepID=UPI0002E22671|nr:MULTISPECIES: hypothetical protein [Mycolicibacterium]